MSSFKLDFGQYEVEVKMKLWLKDGIFLVKATDKISKRYSYITNMNGLASQFSGYDTEKPTMQDSSWEYNATKVKSWYAEAKMIFSNKQFQEYFLRCLNDDRCAGEWENVDRETE